MRTYILLPILMFFTLPVLSQNGIIEGRLVDAVSNEPLPFANIAIEGTDAGTSTDEEGYFTIQGLKPGLYTIQAQYVGYQSKQIPEIRVSNSKPAELIIKLEESTQELAEVVVKADPFERSPESPLSVQSLGIAEIERSPGANRDISRVVQTLPGVATTVAFRNDLLVRGGGPAENSFYLDGIEIPVINHFATQGASGGPVGIINANLLKNAKLYSSAFPSNRGGALSSVLELTQKDGRSDRLGGMFTLGSSDVGLTAEGPIGDEAHFIVSARHSYLQWLFRALELPFLPTYSDLQYRVNYKPSNDHEFTLIGLGAIDQFELNEEADETEYQQYLLDNLPVTPQWNYTQGLVYKNYRENSYTTLALRRSKLYNRSYKYEDNDEDDPDKLLQDYTSVETYNSIRAENTSRINGFKINVGGEFEYNTYETDNYQKIAIGNQVEIVDFNSNLHFNTYTLFGQVSKSLFNDQLSVSAGFRSDFSDYSDAMNHPLDQLSPRLSLSYQLNDRLSVNANTGIYYQLPPFTILGYKNDGGDFENMQYGIKYIRSTHYVAGLQYVLPTNTKISLEGFYKQYDDYPFLTRDSITLANLGSDFGTIGNEPAVPTSGGRSYGAELFVQQKLYKGWYGLLSYTFVRSEFTDKNDDYVPSSWDSRHVLSLTGGKRWDNGWQIGFRFGWTGGLPYTPYDVERSSLKGIWDVQGMGVLDYDQLNTNRLDAYHFLDVRVDRKWFFEQLSLNLYLDVQNVYGNAADEPPILTVERGSDGQPLEQADDPTRYQTKFIDGSSSTVLPTLGIIFEY